MTINDFKGNDVAKKQWENGKSTCSVLMIEGSSGVGKTTLARIIASEYSDNIKELDTVDYTSTIDLNKIYDSMLESTKFSKKVFIFDEFQMLAEQVQSRFLKILEDVPANTLIILVTDNLDKVLNRIKNRCHSILHLDCPTKKDCIELLMAECLSDNKPYSYEGLEYIYNISDSVREMLYNVRCVLLKKQSATLDSIKEVF